MLTRPSIRVAARQNTYRLYSIPQYLLVQLGPKGVRLLRRCSLLTYLIMALLVHTAVAGVNKKLIVKPDTPEGNFLELISLETDYDNRLALIGQFTVMFPKSESIGWAFSQIQDANLRYGHWDNAIQPGDKLL